MIISRRTFLKYGAMTLAAMGATPHVFAAFERALKGASKPPVLWLNGSSCTGCSVSFLNRIATDAPETVVDVLTDTVYHPTVMAAAGDPAAAVLRRAYRDGGYILILEGGVPTAFNGNACMVYSLDGVEVSYMEAVTDLSARAAHIVCVGTCACFGGIPASGFNQDCQRRCTHRPPRDQHFRLSGQSRLGGVGCRPTHRGRIC